MAYPQRTMGVGPSQHRTDPKAQAAESARLRDRLAAVSVLPITKVRALFFKKSLFIIA